MAQNLENNRTDIIVTDLKMVASLVPGVGSFLSELIGQIIPGQRQDRIANFLRELDVRMRDIEMDQLQVNTYFVDILEDAALQSIKALSEERNKYLANFTVSSIGISDDQFEVKKKLIFILSELTDLDVEILNGFYTNSETKIRKRFQYEHLAVGPYRNLSDAEKKEYDSKSIAWDMHISTLERLALIYPDYEQKELRLNSKVGMPKIKCYRISVLGSLLLRSISEIQTAQ
jgi:hypothetical protein